MKNRLLRTFISIPVPNSVKNVKQMLTSTCEDEKVVIRWVKHNNLHITLQFLGFTATPFRSLPARTWREAPAPERRCGPARGGHRRGGPGGGTGGFGRPAYTESRKRRSTKRRRR